MPALLAYFVSLVVFIGTGYGAVQWLTAPEAVRTVTVAKKAAPKAHRPAIDRPANESDAADIQTAIKSQGEATPADIRTDAVASDVSEERARTPETDIALNALAYTPPVSGSKSSPSAAPAARSIKATSEPEAISRSETRTRLKREAAPREHKTRQASRAPQLMTLRTIEFADGHRETRLLPYRGHREVFAMERD